MTIRRPSMSLMSIFWVCAFFAITQQAWAAKEPTLASHLANLQKVAKQVGIEVVTVPSGSSIWEYKSKVPLVPASLVKILTSYTALKNVGPFHHFETGVWALRKPHKGTVGNIWIKSEGDFHLVGENLWTLATQLQRQGIRAIQGDVFIDNSYFAPKTERICIDGKCGSPYNPVISATAVDFNTINFVVLPGDGSGSPAQVKWFPPGDYPEVINQAKTVTKTRKTRLRLVSLGLTKSGREQFSLSGNVPIRSNRSYQYRFNVKDPVSFAGYSFREVFEQVGIKFSKKSAVKSSQVPAGAVKLINYESPPLGDTLYGLNRYSNNFMAEMLLRSLGGLVLSPPGTVSKGVSVIHQTLAKLGIPEREVILDSGSGLSRNCRVSPQVFCRVLSNAYSDFSLGPELLSSMAMNAEEGTLRKRLRRSPVTVRGKTGTLRNVCAFAGYVSYPGKGNYAVTILLNDVKNLWEAKKAMYEMVEDIPVMAR